MPLPPPNAALTPPLPPMLAESTPCDVAHPVERPNAIRAMSMPEYEAAVATTKRWLQGEAFPKLATFRGGPKGFYKIPASKADCGSEMYALGHLRHGVYIPADMKCTTAPGFA